MDTQLSVGELLIPKGRRPVVGHRHDLSANQIKMEMEMFYIAVVGFMCLGVGLLLIGHNIRNFGLKFLDLFFERKGQDWQAFSNNYLDTVAFYKAKKLCADRYWYETFNDFTERIMDVRSHVKFNVEIGCEKLEIDMTGLIQHRAMADAILTNETFKE